MDELKIIESELVPVYETDKGEKVVYGLELHEALEVKSNYREWITRRFDDIEAVENKEFQAVEISTPSGQAKKNHIIKLSTAKEMAMLERNDKGKQVRRYFITVEEKFKEVAQAGITHNVKQLTMDSREIAKIVNKTHAWVMKEIECCILTMQGMGFNTRDFFKTGSYLGANNQWNSRYDCTEQGCEWFSRQLSPELRKAFIEEFKDRFERMQNVLDGKPVKDVAKRHVICLADLPELEAVVRVYKGKQTSIISVCGELYMGPPDQTKLIENLMPKLEKMPGNVVPDVLRAVLESSSECHQIEMLNEYPLSGISQPKNKPESKAPNALQTDPDVNLDEVLNLSEMQAKTRYNIGKAKLAEIADKAGAIVFIGKKKTYCREVLDKYFRNLAE